MGTSARTSADKSSAGSPNADASVSESDGTERARVDPVGYVLMEMGRVTWGLYASRRYPTNLHTLDEKSDGFAATDAERSKASLRLLITHCVEKRGENACT